LTPTTRTLAPECTGGQILCASAPHASHRPRRYARETRHRKLGQHRRVLLPSAHDAARPLVAFLASARPQPGPEPPRLRGAFLRIFGWLHHPPLGRGGYLDAAATPRPQGPALERPPGSRRE